MCICPMLNYYLYVVPKNEFVNPFNGKIINLQNWVINKFSSHMKNHIIRHLSLYLKCDHYQYYNIR